MSYDENDYEALWQRFTAMEQRAEAAEAEAKDISGGLTIAITRCPSCGGTGKAKCLLCDERGVVKDLQGDEIPCINCGTGRAQ